MAWHRRPFGFPTSFPLGVNRVVVLGSVPTGDERLAGQLDFVLGSLRMA